MWPHYTGHVITLHWSCEYTTLVMWPHYTYHVLHYTAHVTTLHLPCTTLHCSCDYTTLVMWPHYTYHVTTLHLSCDHYTYHVTTLHWSSDYTTLLMWLHLCDYTTLVMWPHYTYHVITQQDVLTGHVTHTTHVVMYCLRELVLHVTFLLAMAIFCDRVGSNRLSLAIFRMEWSDLGVPGRAGSFCRLVLNASSNSEKSSSSRMVSSSSWVKTVPAICVGGRLTQFNNGSRYLVSIFLFIG